MRVECPTLPLFGYSVSAPNVRLKLANLPDALPVWTSIADVNDDGDLMGTSGSIY